MCQFVFMSCMPLNNCLCIFGLCVYCVNCVLLLLLQNYLFTFFLLYCRTAHAFLGLNRLAFLKRVRTDRVTTTASSDCCSSNRQSSALIGRVNIVKQVKLGGRHVGKAGCLSYSSASSQDAANSNVPIIVVVGTIGLALIVMLVVVAIRTFLRCRRRLDEERQPLDSPHKVCYCISQPKLRFVLSCTLFHSIVCLFVCCLYRYHTAYSSG